MVEWSKGTELYPQQVHPCPGIILCVYEGKYGRGEDDNWYGEIVIEKNQTIRRRLSTEDEAKQWCITEARRILTEALEKLDG